MKTIFLASVGLSLLVAFCLVAHRIGVMDGEENATATLRQDHSAPQPTLFAEQLAYLCSGLDNHYDSIASVVVAKIREQHCFSYVESVVQTARAMETIGAPRMFCGTAADIPDVKAVARYIDDHPEIKKKPAAEATLGALANIYSCER